VGPHGLFDECHGGHDLAGGAVAALVAVVLDEGGLHGVQIVGLAEAFDGGDFFACGHDGEGQAGVHTAAVDMDGACSALAVVAALLGAGEVEALTHQIEQRDARLQAGEVVLFAVDGG
jgi:hypothetical protein